MDRIVGVIFSQSDAVKRAAMLRVVGLRLESYGNLDELGRVLDELIGRAGRSRDVEEELQVAELTWRLSRNPSFSALLEPRLLQVFSLLSSLSGVSSFGAAPLLMSSSGCALAAVACTHLVQTASDELISEAAKNMTAWPLRDGVPKWFEALFEALREKKKREALFRCTFAALENAVMQLFVPSCRRGALSVVETLLYGYQTDPSAFHSVLPALRHLLGVLEAEKAFVEAFRKSGKQLPKLPESGELFSCRCVAYLLNHVNEPPKFDVTARFNDVLVAMADAAYDVQEDLKSVSQLLTDMMALFTGFFSWYAPVIAVTKQFIGVDYETDLQTIRYKSWTAPLTVGGASRFGGSASGWPAGSSSSSSSSLFSEVAPPRSEGESVGLQNLGNTCYLNSLLQALYHADQFREQVVRSESTGRVVVELSRVFDSLTNCKRKSFAPSSFLKVIPEQYRLGDQQDASEFAKHLLDTLERELRQAEFMWRGRTVSSVTCEQCKTCTERLEPFVDLSVHFPMTEKAHDASRNGSALLSVDEMLRSQLAQEERMTGDNAYRCGHCEALVNATLRTQVAEAPLYLMLTLQRFYYSGGGSKKILSDVVFEPSLQLPVRDAKEPVRYTLFAVVFHSGLSANHGHYYTYASDAHGIWRLFNDSMVQIAAFGHMRQISQTFAKDTAYILFYKRN